MCGNEELQSFNVGNNTQRSIKLIKSRLHKQWRNSRQLHIYIGIYISCNLVDSIKSCMVEPTPISAPKQTSCGSDAKSYSARAIAFLRLRTPAPSHSWAIAFLMGVTGCPAPSHSCEGTLKESKSSCAGCDTSPGCSSCARA